MQNHYQDYKKGGRLGLAEAIFNAIFNCIEWVIKSIFKLCKYLFTSIFPSPKKSHLT
jgi:hypothetical protein